MVLTHRVRLLALCTLARAASGVRSVLVTGANTVSYTHLTLPTILLV